MLVWDQQCFLLEFAESKWKRRSHVNTAGHGDCRLQGWVGSPEMAKRRLCYSQCHTCRQIIQSSSGALSEPSYKRASTRQPKSQQWLCVHYGYTPKVGKYPFLTTGRVSDLKSISENNIPESNFVWYTSFALAIPVFLLISFTSSPFDPVPSILWRRMSTEQSHLQRLHFDFRNWGGLMLTGCPKNLVMPVLALSSSPRAGQVYEFQDHSEHPQALASIAMSIRLIPFPASFSLPRINKALVGCLKPLL